MNLEQHSIQRNASFLRKCGGHILNEEGIKSDPDKIESVREMDTRQNVADALRFLEMVNQLGTFVVDHLAEKTKNQFEIFLVKTTSFTGSQLNENASKG